MKQKQKIYLLVVGLVLVLGLGAIAVLSRRSESSQGSDTDQGSQSNLAQEEPQKSREKTAQELLAESKEAYQKKDLKSAESLIRQAETKAKTAEIYNLWGNILRDLGQKEEAKAKYQQAIDSDKSFISAYLNLATIYQDEENYDQALAVINEGLKHNPDNEELLNSKNLIEVLKLRSEQ